MLREGLELALRSGTIANGGWIAGSLGDLLQLIGQLEEAEENERLALSLAQRVGDEPLIGQRLISLATVVLWRGRIDEAVAIRDEAVPVMAANPEPQAFHFIPAVRRLPRRSDAMTERRRRSKFAEAADHVRAHSIDSYPEIFPECARAFLLLGDRERAGTYRTSTPRPIPSRAWRTHELVAGLLEADPARAIDILRRGYRRVRAARNAALRGSRHGRPGPRHGTRRPRPA